MHKELVIAIVIGVMGGLVVFGGIKIANDAKNNLVSPQSDIISPAIVAEAITDGGTSNPTPSTDSSSAPTGYKLTITQPQPYQLIESDRLILKGASNPEDKIIIIADVGSYYLSANDKGNFDQEVKLTSGYNSITVFAVNKDGNNQKLDLTYISSPTKI
mgnify:CR=1 FL=1